MRTHPVLGIAAAVAASFVTLFAAATRIDAQPLTITHFAGSTGGPGWFDGTGSAAQFNGPAGVAVDSAGNVYVADTGNHTIRKVTPDGSVTTLAGTATFRGSVDGRGSAARFYEPRGIAVDSSGNVYVADTGNHVVRRITADGVVSTIAGLPGVSGSADGTGAAARFNFPRGVAVDGSGNIWVTDYENHTIRRISPSGQVLTVAGLVGDFGHTDGTGPSARFGYPSGVTVDGAGNAYVVDDVVRKITPGGVVTTFAGVKGLIGSADGVGTAAFFFSPEGICADREGNLFVTDTGNHTIRKITPSAVVSTLAGQAGLPGSADGATTTARFNASTAIAVDGAGNLYVADTGNSSVRRVASNGVVSTLSAHGGSGSADGIGDIARFSGPRGLALDGSGNIYVADAFNHTIRKVDSAGNVSTLAGTAGLSGASDGTGPTARFKYPSGVAVDGAGTVYVADMGNHTIRRISVSGVVTTLAGRAGVRGSDDGAGSTALFDFPMGIAVDGAGDLYVGDGWSGWIRKVTPAGLVSTFSKSRLTNPTGIAVDVAGNLFVADYREIRRITPDGVVQTFVGGMHSGSADGTGWNAQFDQPAGVAVDATGVLWVADRANSTIRKVTPSGVVSTVAGLAGFSGDLDGTGPAARFGEPWGIVVDASGTLFVADRLASCIRRGTRGRELADAATIDSPFGFTGEVRRLGTAPRTATTWRWEVVRRPPGSTADFSASEAREPTFTPDRPDLYVFRLTASDDSGAWKASTVSLTVRSPGPPQGPPVTSLLPIVLDVTAGSAHYTTELALTNNATVLLPFSLVYTASLGEKLGSGTLRGYLAPGEQKTIGDVLSWLRAQGLAIPPASEDGQQGGTLLVRFDGDGSPDPKLVSATARTSALTTAPQPVGRAGLAYPGLREADVSTSSVIVHGLRSTASDRTNLAVFNASEEPVTLKVTVCASSTSSCVVHRSAETLQPWGWKQYGSAQLLDENRIASAYAVVERTSATGSFGAYSVINDNTTNDGSFVLAGGRAAGASTLTVPVLVETYEFLSELILSNGSSSAVSLGLNYVESLSPSQGKGGIVTVILGPREQRVIPEAIDFLRRSGAAIGPTGPGSAYGGTLRITTHGTTADNVFAGARTSARSRSSAGGQFGLFTPAVYGGQEASTEAWLYGLRRDAENRTNVAVLNAGGDSDGTIDLCLEKFDAGNEGRPRVGRWMVLSLAPGQWRQLDNFLGTSTFSPGDIANGWVKVTRLSGTAPWIAYAVINDGRGSGERTGDGAYVPMVK